jgi:hypothetical protein
MNRQEGYYWVQYGTSFEIAKWINNNWFVCGYKEPMQDIDFNHINENRIKSLGELPD